MFGIFMEQLHFYRNKHTENNFRMTKKLHVALFASASLSNLPVQPRLFCWLVS